jgi:hypothetical protein
MDIMVGLDPINHSTRAKNERKERKWSESYGFLCEWSFFV